MYLGNENWKKGWGIRGGVEEGNCTFSKSYENSHGTIIAYRTEMKLVN
jgi:hypothetical protein